MTSYKGKTVKTWADGHGRWFAEVTFPDSGYGNAGDLALDRHWDSIRAAARRAIRAELLARAPRGAKLAPVCLEVMKTDFAGTNVWYGVTFAEVAR